MTGQAAAGNVNIPRPATHDRSRWNQVGERGGRRKRSSPQLEGMVGPCAGDTTLPEGHVVGHMDPIMVGNLHVRVPIGSETQSGGKGQPSSETGVDGGGWKDAGAPAARGQMGAGMSMLSDVG
jgi:hypothetical protein